MPFLADLSGLRLRWGRVLKRHAAVQFAPDAEQTKSSATRIARLILRLALRLRSGPAFGCPNLLPANLSNLSTVRT